MGLVTISISSTLESVFGDSSSFKGNWRNLEEFFLSFGKDKVSKIVSTQGNLYPYIRVVKNGHVLRVTNASNISLTDSDEISLFLAASGG